MSRVLALGTLILVWLALATPPVAACVIPSQGRLPVCDLPAPNRSEAVVIVNSDVHVSRRTNLLMGEQGRSPGLLDIELKQSPRPLYVVLSHNAPMIFRFSGALASLSRVIALGSVRKVPDHVGIMGVQRGKIAFVPVRGLDPRSYPSCGHPPSACVLEHFFRFPEGYVDSRNRSGESWRRRAWPLHRSGSKPFQVLDIRNSTRIEIPTGSSELVQRDGEQRWSTPAEVRPDLKRRLERRKTLSELEKYRENNPQPMAVLDPASVISLGRLRVMELPPSWEGMAELERRGKVHGPGSAVYREIYEKWQKRAGRPDRSRLDSGSRLRPPVDFVVTSQVKIPSGLRPNQAALRVVLLVNAGVPTPDSEVSDRLWFCFLFVDERAHRQTCRSSDLRRSGAIR